MHPIILFLNILFFRERGREGEREGEKHQCVVASHAPPTGDLARTQACALTGNRTGGLQAGAGPLSNTSQADSFLN